MRIEQNSFPQFEWACNSPPKCSWNVGGELAILNRKSAAMRKVMTITGTPRQILSQINEEAGGISFASGVKILKFERGGYLGQSLKVPVWINQDQGGSEGTMDALVEQARAIQAVSKRIDRIEVV